MSKSKNKQRTSVRRNESPTDLSTMVYGKVPPQARDLEEALLGIILQPWEKDAMDNAAEILTPDCFYVDAHQHIFVAMKRLSGKGQPIDVRTVAEELRSLELLDIVGGPYYLSKLTGNVTIGTSVEHYARIIYQKHLQREMIRLCGNTISEAYEDSTDVFDLVESHEKALTEITTFSGGAEMTTMDAALVKAVQELEVRRSNEDHLTGTASGFKDLDAITHGWQDTDLIIIAARPSVGKTALAIQFARNAALHPEKPKTVGFFSLEMSTGQLVQRLMSAESEIPLEAIATGRMEEYEMEQLYKRGLQRLAHAKLFFDDTPALNISQLRARCRKLKRRHSVGLIVIDYLQLMSGLQEGKQVTKSGNREQEISHISRSLKALAKELQVPVIALSQMSREVEKRKDFEPMLSDLRESGAIEQDADMVVFIYRPEYHDVTQNEMGESTAGETVLKIAKHRNGKLGKVKLTAKLHIQKFVDYQGVMNTPAAAMGFKPIGTRASVEDELMF